MKLVVLGLSITSSWGNGHATTWRALLRAFAARGHAVTFLERDVPWYAKHRDLAEAEWCRVRLYRDLPELRRGWAGEVAAADAVILGSYVPEGPLVARWLHATAKGVKAFYDIDTPVTLEKLAKGDHEYIDPEGIAGFDLYLSFTGGPTLGRIEATYGVPRARALYCSVDADVYRPSTVPRRWAMGYLGTWSADRQPKLDALLVEPAKMLPKARFVVAGPQYPPDIAWPANVERIPHLAPPEHPAFYAAQGLTLNVTRAAMVEAGWSPSVRLFEAAACAVPIVSDRWAGLDEIFRPAEEILLADAPADVLAVLTGLDESERTRIGAAARARVLQAHTASARAAELEHHLAEAAGR